MTDRFVEKGVIEGRVEMGKHTLNKKIGNKCAGGLFKPAKPMLVVMLLLGLMPLHEAVAADFSGPAISPKVTGDVLSSFVLRGTTRSWQKGIFEVNAEIPTSALNINTVQTPRSSIPLLAGRVLVAGWVANRRISASAELYDPSTDTWLAAGIVTKSGDDRNAVFPRTKRMIVWGGVIIPF